MSTTPDTRQGADSPLLARAAQAPHHNGDLGHNASVYYEDDPYSDSEGERFYVKSVMLTDKMRHVALIPSEALSLLAWLKQEEAHLHRLQREQEGTP